MSRALRPPAAKEVAASKDVDHHADDQQGVEVAFDAMCDMYFIGYALLTAN